MASAMADTPSILLRPQVTNYPQDIGVISFSEQVVVHSPFHVLRHPSALTEVTD